jgi:ATP-dependent DNA helicase RecQ
MATAARKRAKSNKILETGRKHFGFDSLRPGQEEAIRSLMGHRDTLVVQPTGSGKSAIYQIAGLLLEGVTVVVSPLIALQKDQAESINEQDAPEAVLINSTQRAAELREAADAIEQERGKYILLAPEQLRKQETVEMLARARVSLFVVDEAHCISEWGHDFRPDYLQLGAVIERLGHPVVLALTATASPEDRREIVERLGMRRPKLLVGAFDRPNIYLRVDRFETEDEKREALIHRVRWAEKPGIVYVATRKAAADIAGRLMEEGIGAVCYHGAMKAEERNRAQEKFMSGDAEVIVATNAFGMGVDKSDIRFVYHYQIPESLDAYYQEIGRAGRDGEKAEATLFFWRGDLSVAKFHSGEGKLVAEEVGRVAAIIADQEGPIEREEIAEQANLSSRKLASAIHRLEDVGILETLASGEVRLFEDADLDEAAETAAKEQERRRERRREHLVKMQEYAETASCRRELLLRYFGDDFTGPCNYCDNCEQASGAGQESGEATRREVI